MTAKIKEITARTNRTWIHHPNVAPLTIPSIQRTNKMTVIVQSIERSFRLFNALESKLRTLGPLNNPMPERTAQQQPNRQT